MNRHLGSQLHEMGRLIDKMLSAEFERYATADLNRPLDGEQGVLEEVSIFLQSLETLLDLFKKPPISHYLFCLLAGQVSFNYTWTVEAETFQLY